MMLLVIIILMIVIMKINFNHSPNLNPTGGHTNSIIFFYSACASSPCKPLRIPPTQFFVRGYISFQLQTRFYLNFNHSFNLHYSLSPGGTLTITSLFSTVLVLPHCISQCVFHSLNFFVKGGTSFPLQTLPPSGPMSFSVIAPVLLYGSETMIWKD